MVNQVAGRRGCSGGRRRLMLMVLMVEVLMLLQHQMMMILRQVTGWRCMRVRVSGVVRESEGAKGAMVVVPRGWPRGPLTPRDVPGPSSATPAGSRGRYEEDLSRERIFGQLISHRNRVLLRRVPSRRGRTGAGRKVPRRQLLVGTGRRPVGRVPLVRQEGVGGRRRLGPHARRSEV